MTTFEQRLKVLEDLLRQTAQEAKTEEQWTELLETLIRACPERRKSHMPWGGMPYIALDISHTSRPQGGFQ